MIEVNVLDKFKDAYLDLFEQKAGEEINNLYLAPDHSIASSIKQDAKNINLTIELFLKAKNNNDELAVQAALLRISAFLSGITGVLEQTREDIEVFVQLPDTADFPDNYKIPEHYNYPLK